MFKWRSTIKPRSLCRNLLKVVNNVPTVVGVGNPLLDVSLKLKDKELLKKYNIQKEYEYLVTREVMDQMVKDIAGYETLKNPGGSTQNTLRFLEWTLRRPRITVMIGTVGNDEEGKTLERLVEAEGVLTRFAVHPTERTGQVLAFVQEEHVTLVAEIGAAKYLTLEHVKTQLEDPILETVDIILVGGFVLIGKDHSFAQFFVDFCKENHKILAFNLSSVGCVEMQPETVMFMAMNCEFLFGNKREYEALKKVMKFDGSVENLCIFLSKTYKQRCWTKLGKVSVYTFEEKQVFSSFAGGKYQRFTVPFLDKEYIKDSTGAGDAFISGFFAAVLKRKNMDTALTWATWTAEQKIQGIGVLTPSFQSYIDHVHPLG